MASQRVTSRRRFLGAVTVAAAGVLLPACADVVALPEPRPIPWDPKPLESAQTGLRTLPDGRMELRIRHAPLRGITPAMLYWWFTHIGGEMEYQGATYSRYGVWHPRDHIDWQLVGEAPGGGAGVGARFRIVEALGRNMEYLVDSVELIEKLDEDGIVLTRWVLGHQILRLEHEFVYVPAEGATRYLSCMVLGSPSVFGQAVLNGAIRRRFFSEAMGRAWLTHNVEEVGHFERFLPALHARHGGPSSVRTAAVG
jgi:hypothetical protein